VTQESVSLSFSIKTIGYLQQLAAAVASAATRGADEPHKQALEEGVADVLAAITLLVERHELGRDAINQRVSGQVEHLRGWLAEIEPPAPPEPVKKRSWWRRRT
jgi:hypothetical protein